MKVNHKVRTTSGLIYDNADDVSVLDAALDKGFHFEYSCGNGQCGVCKTGLIEGHVAELRPQIALTEEDAASGKVLICCCAPASDILIDAEDLSALQGIEIKTFPARIDHIAKYTENILEVGLRLPPTANFQFLEGQYIDVIGRGGVRRSYSLANSADEEILRLYIRRRDNGIMSRYWFFEAKENDLLRIEGPKGSFFLREENDNIVFLATGTGIAPIKSMLDKLDRDGVQVDGKKVSLYWGNRCPEEFFWKPDYANIKVNYVPVLSGAYGAWGRRKGYVQDALLEDMSDMGALSVYACGSPEMISSSLRVLIQQGLKETRFHADAFVSS